MERTAAGAPALKGHDATPFLGHRLIDPWMLKSYQSWELRMINYMYPKLISFKQGTKPSYRKKAFENGPIYI